jgi:class 3 adenylate cyclase/tetratricopeptide (TPR) repeat protein
MDIASWLRDLGLERYASAFRDNEIDWDALPKLTAEDLKDLGVVLGGHRRRLLDAIAALGTAVPAVATATPRGTPATAGAERRRLTVMFCDLAGSTALATRLDPEDLREVIAAYHRAVSKIVTGFDGFVAKYMGDGVLIYFGYPRAHEDDAERAVRAALGSIDAVHHLDVKIVELQARIGIATGLVVVGDLIGEGSAEEQSVVGETPNLAARLQEFAEPNTVIIDNVTRTQVGRLLECQDLGAVALKGLPVPVRIWQVLPEEPTQNRFEALRPPKLSPLVGREAELDYLLQRWRRARQGVGGAIIVSGDAGIGKSRLIAAMEERLEDEAPTWLRYFCSPHHTDTPLHPVITAVRHEAGIVNGDTDAQRLHKLRSVLAPTMPALPDIALIAELLSIPQDDREPILDASPQVRKERTFAALVSRLRQLAPRNPLLIVLEDAHWADASSIELFETMLSALPEIPALLIVSIREDDTSAWRRWDGVGTLRLPRLDRHQAAVLARSVQTDAALPPQLLQRIVDQTDGVPLFVEELTKNVLETALGRGLDGADVMPLAVPATLQASLMARLDRIPAAKEVGQMGAVLGREFSHALLLAIAGLPEPALLHGLRQLVEAGLASRRGTPPDAIYAFKHALIRDTAYSMLLRSRRRELHALTAAALEDHSPELRDQQPELLAHHYTQAGMVEPAIGYWTSAGRRSVARSAMIEAAAQLRQGLALVPELPEGPARLRHELELQSTLGGALFVSQNWFGGQALQAYRRAQELSEQLGDTEAAVPVLSGLFHYHIGQCKYSEAREIAAKLLQIAEQGSTPSVQLIARRCMAVCLHWAGESADALDHFNHVLNQYDPARHRQLGTFGGWDPVPVAAIHSSWDLLILGYPDQALARFEFAASQRRHIIDKHSLAFALVFGGHFSLFLQDQERAFRQFTDTVALATEQKFPHWLGLANFGLGSILVVNGDCAQGLALARAGYAQYSKVTDAGSGMIVNMSYWLALLAGTCEAAGFPAEACAHLDDAISAVEQSGERWFEPELHRQKGEWLLRHVPVVRPK